MMERDSTDKFVEAGARMRVRRAALAIRAAFLLLLLPRLSTGHGREGVGGSSSKQRRKRATRDTRECMHQQRRKGKLTLWPRRGQRGLSRQAYRMAILSSLAYHDFDEKDGFNATSNSRGGWAFSLVDDASPPQYLQESHDRSRGNHMSGQKLLGHNENHSVAPSRRKRRNRLGRALSDINARFRASLCRTRHVAKSKLSNATHNATDTMQRCKRKLLEKHDAGKRYQVKYVFNNWHEEKAKIRWHDTDLIIAASGKEIVLAFAGTASAADAVTNVQTLEAVSHSGLFDQQTDAKSTNATIEGGIHRGFLNAYARVTRGKIRRLGSNAGLSSTTSLDEYFRKCITHQNRPKKRSTAVATIGEPKDSSIVKKLKGVLIKRRRGAVRSQRRNQVCKSNGNRLMDILREVTTKSLQTGHTVHLVGHSLAGSLATIHALDIVMNHADTPIRNMHLWTFGAPEIADSAFFESAGSQSRRVRNFLSDGKRYHRYVTQSQKNCATDLVASITSKSLNRPSMKKIGGVRGDVIHTIEPSFLVCNATGGELHEMRSYLRALSSSAPPGSQLDTDFPPRFKRWLGETLREEGK